MKIANFVLLVLMDFVPLFRRLLIVVTFVGCNFLFQLTIIVVILYHWFQPIT